MPFILAGVAEMMRSQQKDSEVCLSTLLPLVRKTAELSSQLYSSFAQNNLINLHASWSSELELLSSCLYYTVTTLSGQQTIGEEYVNIIQVDGTRKYHPKFLRRCLMVSLHCFGPYLVSIIVNQLKAYVRLSQWIASSRKPVAMNILDCSYHAIQWLYRLQKSFFFLKLSRESLSKEMTSISYITIRGTPIKEYSCFKVLGYLGLIQSTFSLYNALLSVKNSVISAKSSHPVPTGQPQAVSAAKCPMCYDQYTDITSSECGHLFCWSCIYPWCSTKRFCPICRTECEPRGLVRLINFDF